MTPDLEAALVRLCRDDGSTLGTGFFASTDGSVLTCNHVVDGLETVGVETTGKVRLVGRIEAADRFPALDLAVVRTDSDSPAVPPIAPEPEDLPQIWTKGFQFGGGTILDAFPLTGELTGRTTIHYSTGAQQYRLDGVLVLRDAPIDYGLSGAPLVDRDAGVVIGVVNAQFAGGGGFAVPISRGLAAGGRLAELLAENAHTVPRFGTYLDAGSARKLCTFQARRARQALIDQGLFLSNQVLQRSDLEGELKAFLAGNRKILPIIGPAGTGKTTVLASWIERLDLTFPVVFLRGALLGAADEDLEATLHRELARAAEAMSVPPAPISRAVEQLRKVGQLVVLFDALNEAPEEILKRVERWLSRTAEWLRVQPVRLILTSRQELWEGLPAKPPADVLHLRRETRREDGVEASRGTEASPDDEAGASHDPLRIDDFSADEAVEAAGLYGLPDDSPFAADLRHPLLIRIIWELLNEKVGAELRAFPSRHTVFDGFVRSKVQRVAQRTGALPQRVSHLLKAAAAKTLERGELRLDGATFFGPDLFGPQAEIGEELVREYLFLVAGDDFRFAFDEVGEFLQSSHLSPRDLLGSQAAVQLLTGADWVRIQSWVFALLRLENEGSGTVLTRVLKDLLEGTRSAGGEGCRRLLSAVFGHLTRPADQIESLLAFAEEIVRTYRTDHPEAFWLATRVRLSGRNRLRFLQMLARAEHYYPWEPKHWATLTGELHRPYGVARALGEEIEKDPQPTLIRLMSWFDDETPLQEGLEARVQHVAAGMIFHFAHLAFNEICEELARRADDFSLELLDRIVASEIEQGLAVCGRWLESNDVRRRQLAVRCAHAFLSGKPSGEHTKELGGLFLKHLRQVVDPDLQDPILRLLGRVPHARGEVFQEVVDAFREGKGDVDAWVVAAFFESNFEEVIALFAETVANTSQVRSLTDIVGALGHFAGGEDQHTAVIELLGRIPRDDPESEWRIASAIERQAYQVDGQGEAYRRLVGLASSLYRNAEPATRTFLIYALINRKPQGATALKTAAVASIIDLEDDQGRLGLMIGLLGETVGAIEDLPARMGQLAAKMEPRSLEGNLVHAAWNYPEFAPILRDWLQSRHDLPPRYLAREFLQRIAEGVPVEKAAGTVIHGLASP